MSDRAENSILVAPGLVLLVLAFFLPIGQMLVLSIFGRDGWSLEHFSRFLLDPFYLGVLWRTVYLSLIITLICALLGFPLAYLMARVGPRMRLWLVLVVILPLMTSVVVRTFGWMVLFSRNGMVTQWIRDLIDGGRQFQIMHTESAIVIGLVQVLLPFMTLSILGVITRIDTKLEEAARTMGASFIGTMRSVVLPLSMPGIVAGSLLVFSLSASSFITPSLMGGARIQVLAGSVYQSVTQTLEWPFASAQAVILFIGVLLVLVPYARLSDTRRG